VAFCGSQGSIASARIDQGSGLPCRLSTGIATGTRNDGIGKCHCPVPHTLSGEFTHATRLLNFQIDVVAGTMVQTINIMFAKLTVSDRLKGTRVVLDLVKMDFNNGVPDDKFVLKQPEGTKLQIVGRTQGSGQ
jgi:hypothetical protein